MPPSTRRRARQRLVDRGHVVEHPVEPAFRRSVGGAPAVGQVLHARERLAAEVGERHALAQLGQHADRDRAMRFAAGREVHERALGEGAVVVEAHGAHVLERDLDQLARGSWQRRVRPERARREGRRRSRPRLRPARLGAALGIAGERLLELRQVLLHQLLPWR